MKILFIGTQKYDYLQDLTYSGLYKVLGPRSIIEYAPVARYHLPLKKYPKNLGYQTLNPFLLRHRSLKDIDCVLVAAAKPACLETYEHLLPTLPSSVKTVFIDGGDRPTVGGDLERLGRAGLYERVVAKRPFDVVFKREYLKETDYPVNTHPLPFSVHVSKYASIPQLPYLYDVAFWAVESHPVRTAVLAYLRDRFDCVSNGTIPNQVAKSYDRKGRFYLEELKRTRISLNFRGTGWDTLRFWEVMGLGSFMISQRPGIVIPQDFEEGKEIVYCQDDLSDLESLCAYYLKREDARLSVAANAHKKALAYHTDEVRAKYILSRI